MEQRIVDALKEQLGRERPDLILFVGDTLERDVSPSALLASALVSEIGNYCRSCQAFQSCQWPGACHISLGRAASRYMAQDGKNALNDFARNYLERFTPTAAHHLIARLPVQMIVTTAYDDRLSEALRKAGRKVRHILRNTDVPYDHPHSVSLIQLYGTVSQPDTLRLTDDDSADLFRDLDSIATVLRGLLSIRTTLFLGYPLNDIDPHFRALYREALEPLQRHNRLGIAALWHADPLLQQEWRGKIQIITRSPLELLEDLVGSAEQAQHARRAIAEPQRELPAEPYKFLDFFVSDDVGIFHGREIDAGRLRSWVLAYPFCVLYGESGVGKTSLIRAAVEPRLKAEGYRVVYTRPQDDLGQALRQDLVASFGIAEHTADFTVPLADLVDMIVSKQEHLLIVIDQFEEFFIRQSDRARRQIIDEIAALLNLPGRNIRCLLSMRSDYLHRLDEFEAALGHDPLQRRMRLHNLGVQEAHQSIVGPAESFRISFEPALAEQLLNDLNRGGIAPSQLQIVCYRLWEDWKKRGKPWEGLTLERYDELGRHAQMLSEYLDVVIDGLASAVAADAVALGSDFRPAEAARVILKGMITADRTKSTLSQAELSSHPIVARARLSTDQIAYLLDHLQNTRVVRKIVHFHQEHGRHERYELAHEVMIDRVWEWLTADEQQLLDIQDILDRATSDYRKFGALLPVDRYNLIAEAHLSLQPLEDSLNLLVISAVHYGQDPGVWVRRMEQEEAVRILADLLYSQPPTRHAMLARALGDTRSPHAIRHLSDLLRDRDEQIFRASVESLRRIGMPQVVMPLYLAAQRETTLPRTSQIITALEQIRTNEAGSLLVLLADQHTNPQVRNRAARALVNTGTIQDIRRLIAMSESDDPRIREDLSKLFRTMLEKSVDPFRSLLLAPDYQIRISTLHALHLANIPLAHQLILESAYDNVVLVRLSVTEILADRKIEDADETLLSLLSDNDISVRYAALRSLGRRWDRADVRALGDDQVELRLQAAEAPDILGNFYAFELLNALFADPNSTVRIKAIDGLQTLGDSRVLDLFRTSIKDPEMTVRLHTIKALSAFGELGGFEILCIALSDAEVKVRIRAIDALQNLADPRAIQPMSDLLSDPEVKVRQRVIQALQEFGTLQAITALIDALADPEVKVRAQATNALRALDAPPFVVQMGQVLAGPEVKVPAYVIQALRSLGDSDAVEPLLAALADSDGQTRSMAIQAFRLLGDHLPNLSDQRAVTPLIALLSDPDARIRAQVAHALQALGATQAMAPLIASLADSDLNVRAQAAHALQTLGNSQAVEPLVTLLSDPATAVRLQAIQALRVLGDVRAVEPLINTLSSTEATLRMYGIQALQAIGDHRAVEPIVQLLHDPEASVRLQAIQSLRMLRDSLSDSDPLSTQPETKSLARMQATTALHAMFETLVVSLADPKPDIRAQAVQALRALGDSRTVEPLIAVLSDSEPNVRAQAALALQTLGDSRAIEPLIAVLDSAKSNMRVKVIQALQMLGDSRAVEPLIRMLTAPQTPAAKVRILGIEALRTLNDPRTVDLLIALLTAPSTSSRIHTIQLLQDLGDSRAVEPLITLLADPKEKLRTQAAQALQVLGDTRAVAPLISLLDDPEVGVRAQAAQSLQALGDPRAVEPLIALLVDPNVTVQIQAIQALQSLGDSRAVEPLIRILTAPQTPPAKVCRRVIEALCTLKDPYTTDLVIAELASPHTGTRHQAIELLQVLGDARAVEPIIRVLTDSRANIRIQAIQALQTIGDVRAVEPIIGLLADSQVRFKAIEALGSLGDPRAIAPILALQPHLLKFEQVKAQESLAKLGYKDTITNLFS